MSALNTVLWREVRRGEAYAQSGCAHELRFGKRKCIFIAILNDMFESDDEKRVTKENSNQQSRKTSRIGFILELVSSVRTGD